MERPSDLVYWLEEKPPFVRWLLLGLQHVVVICPYLVLVALVVEAAHLPSREATAHMAMAMLGVVLHTILQSLRWGPLGSGFLCPPVVSAIYLPACMAAAAAGGLPLVVGMILFAGAAEMGLSRIVTRLRKVFPAVVSGIILMAVGIELAKIGLSVAWSAKIVATPAFGAVELVFGVALLTMVGLSVWGRRLLRLLCALIGIVVGYLAAALLGQLPPSFAAEIAAAPAAMIPLRLPDGVTFSATLIVPFAIAGIASGLRTVGVLTTCQQINDAGWTKPEPRSIAGGVLADGLGCAVGGFLSAPGLSASPSLVGIERATGATSRAIVWSIAAWFVLLACLPKLSALIVHMPKPVMAAALFFNGSFMFVGGMQVALSRPVTIRGTFLIGISMMLAMGSIAFPGFFARLPAWTEQITQSPISIATVAAVVLNLLFLLGRWSYGTLTLDLGKGAAGHEDVRAFLAGRAKEWKLPVAEAERIRAALEDLVDRIAAEDASQGPLRIRCGWDQYDVTIWLTYRGSLPYLPSQRVRKDMVEEQAFISGLTGYLSSLNADSVEPTVQDGRCQLTLVFRV
ncbi:MAG: uracil-xanthine permease family protein [Chromatiales bacterium]